MFKSVVNDIVSSDTLSVKVRSSEGAEIVLPFRPDDKVATVKQEIWKHVGTKTQLKIGDAIIDIMTEYIQTTDLTYDAFCALPEAEQVKLLAKSGKFYQKFWQHYVALFDGHIIEDEATLVGLGMGDGDEIAVLPRVVLGKKENLFLQLYIGIRRKHTDIPVGINNLIGMEHNGPCPVRDKERNFHHHDELAAWDQCVYELRLLETVLMPTFDKIMGGDKTELPDVLPRLDNIKTLLRMNYYNHSYDALKDLHDLVENYKVNINIMINFNDPSEELKFEAEKRETMYYSTMELLNKFESQVTNSEDTEYIFPTIFVGPGRSFTQYNYTVALPSVKFNRITSTTTVEDLIESYKHYVGKEDLEIGSLIYDGVEYLPYVIVKNVANKKLNKHFFYFHQDIPNDGRTIDELLNFIDGETTAAPAPVPTPKIKKKRKKNKASTSQQPPEKCDSASEEVVSIAESASTASMQEVIDGAGAVVSEPTTEPGAGAYKLEKSGTDQMKKIWKEFSERNTGQRKIFEASREFDFDITEEEGGPRDMTLEKADYLDKLTSMIAAKAQAEWENKMKGFEKLQEENENIQGRIKEKEKEFDDHKDKITEVIDNQAKAMTNYISVISKTEDEKAENIKEMKQLDFEIKELEERIEKIKVKQSDLNSKCQLCDAQIDKMEKKRKKLEKYMESEMGKVRQEGEQISEEIDKLNLSLAANIKATEDLAKLDVSAKETKETTAPPPVVSDATNRMVEFLAKSIKEKESDLECPVCMETAEVPIFMCQEMHLICSVCRPKVKECPECRVQYQGPPRRHRYAEKTAEELKKLKEEFAQMTSS